MFWLLPCVVFVLLVLLELWHASASVEQSASRADHYLNLAGLAIQGAAIPAVSYLLATRLFAVQWHEWAGTLQFGALGAFLLNFVAIDFLYYWQHRLFHRLDVLWALHRCHHAAPVVNVWASSRNSFLINFLFVYLLLNPLLGFLCDRPEVFFAAASLTASLDLWRHARLPTWMSPTCLERILITPRLHPQHHAVGGQGFNFGANLSIWDRMFGTFQVSSGPPRRYVAETAVSPWKQFLYPW